MMIRREQNGSAARLASTIPDTHAHKADIEGRFRRLLETLGPEWFAAIAREDRDRWSVCLSRRREDKAIRLWKATLDMEEQSRNAIEPWIRALVRRLQDELDLHVGMKPVEQISPSVRRMLLAIIVRHSGGLTSDGHIVVPRETRPRFLDDVDSLGIRLEVGAWERGRTIHAPAFKPAR